MICNYQDTARFYKVTPEGYGNNKVVEESQDVPAIFIQNTGFVHSANQDAIDSDAICYPDPTHSFVGGNFNRLEGMYLMISPFGAPAEISWYKVTNVAVNRDHLLSNTIDNVELQLKKTEAIPGVS